MDKIESKSAIKILAPRLLKATIKTTVIYLIFSVLTYLMTPVAGFFNYQAIFTAFFALYLIFTFAIEFTKNTVFQHILSIANSLIIVLYFTYVLNTGVISMNIEQMIFTVDLRFFLTLFVLGGMLSFAKSMLKLLSWMNDKEEEWLEAQIKSL